MTHTKTRLADAVIKKIKEDVDSGKLASGSQLPSEPQLIEAFGVSRTVIREALAELRAAGFVRPMQGKGVFVTDKRPNEFLSLSRDERRSIPRTIELLEFRTGLEVEAAGLAAIRRSSSQEYNIMSKYDMVQKISDDTKAASSPDFGFHMAIARASNNDFFVKTLAQIGPTSIPRASLPNLSAVRSHTYLETLAKEHDDIATAISRQDADHARAAMRAHLENSQARYRALALALEKPATS